MGIKHSRPVPPFMRYCSAIIPTMFDDSLSYYEALCALNRFIQTNLVEVINNNASVTQEYIQLVDELEEYVEHYFDNLDVQQEINNKLDEMAESGQIAAMLEGFVVPIQEEVQNFETNVNGQLSIFRNKLNQFSGAPVAVSSTVDMTDHDQIYVNTTDGKWYYWDDTSSAFVIGGTYQAASFSDLDDTDMKPKGLTTMPIDFYTGYNLRTDYVNERWGWEHSPMQLQQNGHIAAIEGQTNPNNKCVTTFIPANSYVRIHKSNSNGRFRIGVTNTRPVNGTTCTLLYDVNTATDYCFYNTTYTWLVVYFSHTTDVADPDTVIDVYVDNRNKITEAIRPDNLTICEKHTTSDLFDPYNFVNGIGCDQSAGYYQWRYINQYRSYKFILAPNTTYNIKKIGTSNRFRVCLWRAEPVPAVPQVAGLEYFESHPSVVVVDDNDETTCTFNSGVYLYCTITYSNASESGVTFEITTGENEAEYYQIKRDYLKEYMMTKADGGYQILDGVDANNSLWLQWNARLSYGMTPETAYVPCYFNSQIFVDGTIIAHNTGSQNNNRWGLHVFEGYSIDEHSRITMLLDKNTEYDKATAELYYYTGSGTHANAYGYFKLGSDVKYHSFMFDRDEMIAEGQISCNNPIRLANIDPASDCIFTYDTVEEADSALGTGTVNNAKAVRGIQLKNAQNGTMWFDSARQKLVIKINGKWNDVNTTEVPNGTYNF